jgi:hypothetical protein
MRPNWLSSRPFVEEGTGAGQQMLHGACMAHRPPTNSERGPTRHVSSGAPSLAQQDQDHLGQQLRAMYQELLDEPVPAHFP